MHFRSANLALVVVVFCANCPAPNDTGTTPSQKNSDANDTDDANNTNDTSNTSAGWNAALAVQAVDSQTVGTSTFGSSSILAVSWAAAPSGVDHYEITVVDQTGGVEVTASAPGTATYGEMTALKAGTTYEVTIKQCKTSCAAATSGGTATGATAEEYWQLQGTGDSYGNAKQVVNQGSTLSYAMRLGADSGDENVTQYYYNPKGSAGWNGGVRIATTSATTTDLANLSSFTAIEASGLKQPCTNPEDGTTCFGDGKYLIQASQPVPLTSSEKVRLYFEASDLNTTAKTMRIYYLDSQDGYLGRDFSKNPLSSICSGSQTTNDYQTGGDCQLTVAIGIEADAVAGGTGLSHARQFKIGFPQRDGWRWDDTATTPSFMIITGAEDGNASANRLFMATWNGTTWDVEQSGGKATPLVTAGHGPVVVHLGATRYKMYYEDESLGHNGKPLKLVYANGESTADLAAVDFADWESEDTARDVHFLWPDDSLLSANEESGLGDHMILVPDNDLNTQVMYLNLGGKDNPDWNQGSGGLGVAILLNP